MKYRPKCYIQILAQLFTFCYTIFLFVTEDNHLDICFHLAYTKAIVTQFDTLRTRVAKKKLWSNQML